MSHGVVTLTVGGPGGGVEVPGSVRVNTGTAAQEVAVALQALQTSPMEIAAIFESLRSVGALSAEIIIR